MPRLQLETYLQPDDLFERPWNPDEGFFWSVLHTKPRSEKSLARRLCEWEGRFFLPLHQHRTMRRGRMVTSYLPLFPGYLFVFGTEQDRLKALKTKYVVQCIHVMNQAELTTDLSNVCHLMNSGEGITPELKLEPGKPVEIVHGPFRGMEGRVIRRENRLRFLIEVRLLQRGVSVEMESWMLAPT